MTALPLRPATACVLAAALGLAMPGRGHAAPAATVSAFVPDSCNGNATAVSNPALPPETQALLQQLQHAPRQRLRLIVTLKPGAPALHEARRALQAAGAQEVQPLDGLPMIVAEVNAAQLRALLATGQVLRVQQDIPNPSH